MKRTGFIKMIMIVCLIPIITVIAFPYDSLEQNIHAETVSLEDFDDSPSGKKVVAVTQNAGKGGMYGFLTDDGNVYTYGCSIYEEICGNNKGNIINNMSRVLDPTSTSGNIKYLNNIEKISLIPLDGLESTNKATFLAKTFDGEFYAWGWIPAIPSISPGNQSVPRKVNRLIIENEIITDIQIDGYHAATFSLTESGKVYYSQYTPSGALSNRSFMKVDFIYTDVNDNTVSEKIKKINIFPNDVLTKNVIGYAVSESNKVYIICAKVDNLSSNQVISWGPVIRQDDSIFFYDESKTNILVMPGLVSYGGNNTLMFLEQNSIPVGIRYSDIYSANISDSPKLYDHSLDLYLSEFDDFQRGGFSVSRNNGKFWLPKDLLIDLLNGNGTIKISFRPLYPTAIVQSSSGLVYLTRHYYGKDYALYNTYFGQYTGGSLNSIPDNYNGIKDYVGYIDYNINPFDLKKNTKVFLITNSGAAFANGEKLKFYNDTEITGKKVKDNTNINSAVKYNDSIDVTIKRTAGINNGKIYYKEVDNTSGKIDLTNTSIPETEITDTNGITFNLEINEEQNRIQKTYASYTKNSDGSIIDGSTTAFVVDLYQGEVTVPDLEGQSTFNAGKKINLTYNGFEDNTITAKMNKAGEEPNDYVSGAAINDPGSYTFVASDLYGNSKSYTFSIAGPDDPIGLNFTKNNAGSLIYDDAITKAGAQIGTIALTYGESASSPGTLDTTTTSISAGNEAGYFSLNSDALMVEEDLPAGSYSLTIDGSDTNGSAFSFVVTITIAPKQVNLSLDIDNMTYGETLTVGNDQVVGLPAGLVPVITLESQTDTAGTYTDSVFTPTHIGSASFKVTATDDSGNYSIIDGTKTISVLPKAISISLTNPIIKYPGQLLTSITPSAKDNYTITPALVSGDTLTGTPAYSYESGNDASLAGTKIKVKITGLSNENYTITADPIELTVAQGDTIEAGWYTITGTLHPGFTWYASDVSLSIDATKTTAYDLIDQNTSFASASDSFTINQNGTHEMTVYMKNSVSGKMTSEIQETIQIDKIKPVIQLTGKQGNVSVGSGDSCKGSVTLTPKLTSANPSAIHYYYTSDADVAALDPITHEEDWLDLPAGGLTIEEEGSTTYYVKAVSGAGIISDVQSFEVVINNDVPKPDNINWEDGVTTQTLTYGDHASLAITGLQNKQVTYRIVEGNAEDVLIDSSNKTITAKRGTGTVKLSAKIKGYTEPLEKTITLQKKQITVKTQINGNDMVSIDLNGSLPDSSSFSVNSTDFVGTDDSSILGSITYEYRDDKGNVITPSTNVKGTYKLYANTSTVLDNYDIVAITPALLNIGDDITYTKLTVKAEYEDETGYHPYTNAT